LTKTELKHNGANLHSPAPDDSDDHSLSPSKWRLPLEEDKAANVDATAYHACGLPWLRKVLSSGNTMVTQLILCKAAEKARIPKKTHAGKEKGQPDSHTH